MKRIILKLLLLVFLIFNPLISKAIAQQQYEPYNPKNPNYCTECRDESKRDFAKCGEIDYTQGSLYAAQRTYIHKDDSFPFFQGIDYDPYTKKAVYCANIGKEGAKMELFIVDANMEGNKLIINDLNKQRVTWDSATNQIGNIDPLWTKNRKIFFTLIDKRGEEKAIESIIDTDGSNKRYITPDEYAKLWFESHDKKTGLVNVAPSN